MSDSALLRIQVHDFAGHPFQAQLSRELARRGHVVEHAYAAQYESGKGNFELTCEDPTTLSFRPLESPRAFAKYDPVRRVLFERSYAKEWARSVAEYEPDVVIACNVPLFTLSSFVTFAKSSRLPWVLWHQDIVSMALIEQARLRLPGPFADPAVKILDRLERRTARSARRIIAIGPEFTKVYTRWGLDGAGRVIPNWAPIDEVRPTTRDNAWSVAHDRSPTALRLTYAGTLGKKHNPQLLVDLSTQLDEQGLDAELVVVSEGEGADWIKKQVGTLSARRIHVLPFQPMEEMSDVLGSSDVLVAILEPEASKFSIPSKVLTYFAAGRPVLGFMPADNPAAADIHRVGGLVVPPTPAGVREASKWLGSLTGAAVDEIGTASRVHAEREFNIEIIATAFEEELRSAASQAR